MTRVNTGFRINNEIILYKIEVELTLKLKLKINELNLYYVAEYINIFLVPYVCLFPRKVIGYLLKYLIKLPLGN